MRVEGTFVMNATSPTVALGATFLDDTQSDYPRIRYNYFVFNNHSDEINFHVCLHDFAVSPQATPE